VVADGKAKQTAIRHNDRNSTTHPFMEPTNTNTPLGIWFRQSEHAPREAGEPITDQFRGASLGLAAASENKKHLRQRTTATIRREQTAKNATPALSPRLRPVLCL